MMDAWRGGNLGRAVSVQKIERGQQHHADDQAAARRTRDHHAITRIHKGRCYRGEHALVGCDGVGIGANQAVTIGHTGLHREIVHLVVEKQPGALDHATGTEAEVERDGRGHAIAFAIQYGKVRGLRARCGTGTNAWQRAARRGPVIADRGGQAGGVVGAGQSRSRHADEIRITQKHGTIAMRAAHGLDDEMPAGDAIARAQRLQRENIQCFDERDATGAGRRRRHHARTAILTDDRRALDRTVRGQISLTPDATLGAHARDEFCGKLAVIESLEPVTRQLFEQRGQLRLADERAGGRHRAVAQKIPRHLRIGGKLRQSSLQCFMQMRR